MKQKQLFLPALLLPILALLFLTIFKAYSLQSGKQFILPIKGYDPVNPISGHYVTYRIDYGTETCTSYKKSSKESCICLSLGEDAIHSYVPDCSSDILNQCDAYLKGKCRYGRFEAGIEEYFIPEDQAEKIDKTVRKGKSKIKISVKKDGTALLEDLILIEN